MLELRTAVEADARDAGNFEFDDQHVPLLAGWEIARRTPDGADRTVGKGLGIKAGGGLGILVVPDANRVLCHRLLQTHIAGDEYTIADMAIWPWYGNGVLNGASYNDPRKFLQTHEYKNLTRWTKEIGERPAVKRGRMVNRATGPLEGQLRERHDARVIVLQAARWRG